MKSEIANYESRILAICALVVMTLSPAMPQVASHASTEGKLSLNAEASEASPALLASDKPVAQVNATVLRGHDLLREMYAIFPYARQHNGFPKGMEAQIRRGALEMIIFEELVYQEAVRRQMTIPPAEMGKAEASFRKQFSSREQYQEYLKLECKGSQQLLREKIRRSLLIEALLKVEVQGKSAVSLAETKAFYDKNPKSFQHGESFAIQTISIIPPQNASAEVQKEARKRAEEAWRQAKTTKSYREFGLLAEKISDDDWHVNMGDRTSVEADKLPPPVVQAARGMKPGDVSDLLQFGTNYTLFRLNSHIPAGKAEFEAVKTRLRSDLEKAKSEQVRAALNQRLRKSANVKVL